MYNSKMISDWILSVFVVLIVFGIICYSGRRGGLNDDADELVSLMD